MKRPEVITNLMCGVFVAKCEPATLASDNKWRRTTCERQHEGELARHASELKTRAATPMEDLEPEDDGGRTG